MGEIPAFRMLEDYLPKQKGKVIELREHQQAALDSLQAMREQGESIALLYHATGTGKTVTAVSDAKRLGKRTLFLAHTKELITQAKGTFEELWDQAETGLYVAEKRLQTLMLSAAAFRVWPEIWKDSNAMILAISLSMNVIMERQILIGRF